MQIFFFTLQWQLKKVVVKKTNRKKVMPGDHVTKTNPRKVASDHNPMEKKRSQAAKKAAVTRKKNAARKGGTKKISRRKTAGSTKTIIIINNKQNRVSRSTLVKIRKIISEDKKFRRKTATGKR